MKTIVVVESGSSLADQVRAHVEAAGAKFEVHCAPTRREAIENLESEGVTCIIADADEDDIEGLAFARGALGRAPTCRLAFATDDEDLLYGSTDIDDPVRFVPRRITPTILQSLLSNDRDPKADRNGDLLLDLLTAIRIVGFSPNVRLLRVTCDEGIGAVGLFNGALIHASAGNLNGVDAFLQMALWRETGIAEIDPDTLEQHSSHSAVGVADMIREAINLRMAMISDAFPTIAEPEAEPEAIPVSDLRTWWKRVLAEHSTGARMVIAHAPGSSCHCAHTLTESLAGDLGAIREWSSESTESPRFARIRPEQGGLLNLSVVPMIDKNKFAFESFARSAEIVLICRRDLDAGIDEWKDRVPYRVKCFVMEGESPHPEGTCPALQALIRNEERRRS